MVTQNFSDYLVFVDESGDHSLTSIDPQYPVFVLCFCVIHKDTYFNEITPRIRKLKADAFGHELVVLHEHDIRKRHGAFKALNKEARESFMEDLTSVIADVDMTLVAVVVDKPRHKEKYSDPYHPYHLALQFGLERINSFVHQKGQADRITHVICEARGKREDDELELEFRRVCAGRNRSHKTLPFEIVIAHKQTNSEGLQLADLTARPIGLSVLRPEQPNRAFEMIERKLFAGHRGCVAGNGLKIFP
ncbi:MAG: DUF3800 domain-containing protein [Candidatus Sedimenticola sp. (ex Thyasira tokunagai)]